MVAFGNELIEMLDARADVGTLTIASALPAPSLAAQRHNRYGSALTLRIKFLPSLHLLTD